jgi:ribosome assembly protein 4
MATVLPPPSKRQKTHDATRAREQQPPQVIPEGSIRIRFVHRSNNDTFGPSVAVSLAQASVKNLQLLANSLAGVTDPADRIPYRFFHEHGTIDGKLEEVALADSADIYNALIKPQFANTEDELTLSLSPQAVFKVKAVSRCTSTITGHGQPILTAQFPPTSGSRLATGSGDNTARLWDCDTGTPIKTLQGHTGWVLCVAYSPDGSMLATGSYDNTVRLWEAKTGDSLGGPLKGHSAFIRSLAWEPFHLQQTGRPRLASSSKDATVRVWDAISRKTDFVLSGHKMSVSCVKWGGTGLIYTASQDRTIKVWDSKEGRVLHTLQAHAHWVNHLALSTDQVLRTGYHDPSKDVPKTQEEKTRKALARYENAATVNNKIVERLASASDDSVLYLWEPMGKNPTKPVARMIGHQKAVNHVTFSPDGLYIASSSFDNSIKLWNAQDGKFVLTFRGHVAPVSKVLSYFDSCMLMFNRFINLASLQTLACWLAHPRIQH